MSHKEARLISETIQFDHPVVIAELSPSTPLSYNGREVLWIRSNPGRPNEEGQLVVGAQCRRRGRDLSLHLSVKRGKPYPESKKPELVAEPCATIMWLSTSA